MWEKSVPQMQWEVLVGAAESGDEMILESADRSFGGIAAVKVWRHKLEIDVFVSHELFQHVGAFVVKALKFWTKSAFDKQGMGLLACCED